ncbi:hypothetical protein MOTC310_23825 [Methylobacterium oryzae]|uniref:Uncharacterized protein n=1 Tax=Methylobacterium oryzae TaxID=334852 RepID=A0ABU7TUG5_9HYPH
MAYRISFQNDGREVYLKAWPIDLVAAIAYAKAQLPIQRIRHGARSVCVTCDRTGELVFSLVGRPDAAST